MKRIAILLLAIVVGFVVFELVTFPDVSRLEKEEPKSTAFMERRQRELARAGKESTLQQQWVDYSRISPYLRRAVLVSEDSAFYDHEGVDVEGLKEALRKDWEKKELAAGGSTITQQLAKNLYLSPSKNPYRKVKELLITRELEQELSKKRILEIYLNVVEFGERVYGAEAAARYYFRKPASALTPSEAALLAGCLPNPRIMKPDAPDKRLKRRQRIILSRMRRWGYMLEKDVLASKPKKAQPKEEPPPPVEPAVDLTESAVDTSVPEDVDAEAPVKTPEPTPAETTTQPPITESTPPAEATETP